MEGKSLQDGRAERSVFLSTAVGTARCPLHLETEPYSDPQFRWGGESHNRSFMKRGKLHVWGWLPPKPTKPQGKAGAKSNQQFQGGCRTSRLQGGRLCCGPVTHTKEVQLSGFRIRILSSSHPTPDPATHTHQAPTHCLVPRSFSICIDLNRQFNRAIYGLFLAKVQGQELCFLLGRTLKGTKEPRGTRGE